MDIYKITDIDLNNLRYGIDSFQDIAPVLLRGGSVIASGYEKVELMDGATATARQFALLNLVDKKIEDPIRRATLHTFVQPEINLEPQHLEFFYVQLLAQPALAASRGFGAVNRESHARDDTRAPAKLQVCPARLPFIRPPDKPWTPLRPVLE